MPAAIGSSVLVVDDEAQIRQLIDRILRRNAYDTVTAQDGLVALDRLAERPFDLMISDLRMPGMGGLELLAESRARYPDMDVMILTGYGSIQNAVEAIKLGATEYMTKPFVVSDLQQKVAKCFDVRCSRQARGLDSPLRPLVELHRLLNQSTNLAESLEAIVDLVSQVFAPDGLELLYADTERLALYSAPSYTLGNLPAPDAPRPAWEQIRAMARRATKWHLWDTGEPGSEGVEAARCLTVPLTSADELVGVLTLYRREDAPRFMRPDAELLEVFGLQIGQATLQARARERLTGAFGDHRAATLPAVHALFEALGTYDQYTYDHSKRVSEYARMLGESAGMTGDELDQLAIGGLLHDVGKLGIGEGNLRKNGSLTDDEFDRVKLHPSLGAQILQGVEAFAQVVPLVLYHHERLDGSGYPKGLAGDEIPLGAQILGVVDSWDSMVTDRPYRKALSHDEAIRRLLDSSGAELNPDLVALWLELVPQLDGLAAQPVP